MHRIFSINQVPPLAVVLAGFIAFNVSESRWIPIVAMAGIGAVALSIVRIIR